MINLIKLLLLTLLSSFLTTFVMSLRGNPTNSVESYLTGFWYFWGMTVLYFCVNDCVIELLKRRYFKNIPMYNSIYLTLSIFILLVLSFIILLIYDSLFLNEMTIFFVVGVHNVIRALLSFLFFKPSGKAGSG